MYGMRVSNFHFVHYVIRIYTLRSSSTLHRWDCYTMTVKNEKTSLNHTFDNNRLRRIDLENTISLVITSTLTTTPRTKNDGIRNKFLYIIKMKNRGSHSQHSRSEKSATEWKNTDTAYRKRRFSQKGNDSRVHPKIRLSHFLKERKKKWKYCHRTYH